MEWEVKVEVMAPGALLDRARILGFDPAGEEEQEDLYLQGPDRDFAARDEALRIRRRTGQATQVTFKGPKQGTGGYKIRSEFEFATEDDPLPVFESLGYRVSARLHKHRRIFRGGDMELVLDQVQGLPLLAELEWKGDGELADIPQRLDQVLTALGLGEATKITTSTLELAFAAGVLDPDATG